MNKYRRKEIDNVQTDIQCVIGELGELIGKSEDAKLIAALNGAVEELSRAYDELDEARN